jgi:transcriptional regulator with XRE-family HTH domain
MNNMQRIRKDIFRETQEEFAKIAGTSQGTISRWETGNLDPTREQLARIRSKARRRKLPWNDTWFFDVARRQSSAQARVKARVGRPCGR